MVGDIETQKALEPSSNRRMDLHAFVRLPKIKRHTKHIAQDKRHCRDTSFSTLDLKSGYWQMKIHQ